MIKRLAHVCIGTRDLQKTEDFYCDVLGFEKRFQFIKDGEIVGFYLSLGDGGFLEVFSDLDAIWDQRRKLKHFCLEVENLDSTIEAIRAKGVEIGAKKLGCDDTWQAWFTDPDGIEIELHQYTEASSQLTGRDCVVDW